MYANGPTQLVHVTITDNTASTAPGSSSTGGGISVANGATASLKNSLVIGNLVGGDADDCTNAQAIVSGDYNLIGRRTSCPLTGDLSHVSALDQNFFAFSDLDSNGGFAPDLTFTLGLATTTIPAESCVDDLGAPNLVDQRGYARGGSCDIGARERDARYAPPVLLGVELIRNGGAEGNELGSTDGFAIEQPPYWALHVDRMTQIAYGLAGGFPLPGSAPAGSGTLFFEGGHQETSGGRQRIDVSSLAAAIDAGQVPFRASGAFGGYLDEDDHASLVLLFTNDAEVNEVTSLGGFTAADRGGETRLLPDAATGVVPAGTRFIEVTLEMTRVVGVRNNGYADGLSLMLPEPHAGLLGGFALGAVLSLSGSRRR